MESASFTIDGAYFQDAKGKRIDSSAQTDQINHIRFKSSEPKYEIQISKNADQIWRAHCIAPPTSQVGLIMGQVGEKVENLNLSLYFTSSSHTFQSMAISLVPTFNPECLGTAHKGKITYSSIPILIEHARDPSSTFTMTIGSTPEPWAKKLLSAMTIPPSSNPIIESILYEAFSEGRYEDLILMPKQELRDEAETGVRAHRFVLENIQYFKDMFSSGMAESQAVSSDSASIISNEMNSNTISVNGDETQRKLPMISLDLDIQTLREFIRFLHTGKIEFYLSSRIYEETEKGEEEEEEEEPSVKNSFEARNAWVAGERYGVPQLQALAARHIISNLTIEHVLPELIFDERIHLHKGLKEIYSTYANKYSKVIIPSSSFEEVVEKLASGTTWPPSTSKTFTEFEVNNQ